MEGALNCPRKQLQREKVPTARRQQDQTSVLKAISEEQRSSRLGLSTVCLRNGVSIWKFSLLI